MESLWSLIKLVWRFGSGRFVPKSIRYFLLFIFSCRVYFQNSLWMKKGFTEDGLERTKYTLLPFWVRVRVILFTLRISSPCFLPQLAGSPASIKSVPVPADRVDDGPHGVDVDVVHDVVHVGAHVWMWQLVLVIISHSHRLFSSYCIPSHSTIQRHCLEIRGGVRRYIRSSFGNLLNLK